MKISSMFDVGKIHSQIDQNYLLYRMILYFFIITAVITIVLTTIFCTVFENEMEDETKYNAGINIQQFSNIIQFRAEYANWILKNIQEDEQFTKLFVSEKYDSNEIIKIIQELNKRRLTIPHLYSIYIYNQNAGIVYESGVNSQSSINEVEFFSDQGFTDILDHIDQYPKYTPQLRTIPVLKQNNPGQFANVYTYLIFDRYNTGKTSNIVALNFETGWIKEALGYMQNQEGKLKDIKIINNSGQVIYSPENSEIGGEYARANILKRIEEGDKEGSFILNENGVREIVTYAMASHYSYQDWIFLSINDMDGMMAPVRKIRSMIYLVSLLLLIIGSIGIILLSRRLYKPIQSMGSKIKLLEAEHEKKLLMDRRVYLRNMLYGNVDDSCSVLKSRFEELGLRFEIDGIIRLLLITIDYYDSFRRQYGKQAQELEQSLMEQIERAFLACFEDVLCVEVKEGVYALIIHADESMDEELKTGIEKLKDEVEKAQKLTISISCSSYGESVKSMAFLLSETLNIQSYRYLFGYGEVLTVEDIQRKEKKAYEYPKDWEKKIVSSLFKGEKEETYQAFDEFVKEIYSCSVEEIKLAYLQLAYAIKNYSQSTMAEISSFMLNFDSLSIKIQSLETMQEVNQLLLHMFDEIMEKVRNQFKTKYDKLLDLMKRSVELHYMDSGYAMNDVAEEVSMTSAYLGRLFKQLSGITFTEYLTKYRLEEACVQLCETKKTVNEISDATGFTNSSYFYIVFKKYLNSTPNQYRNEFGKKSGEYVK